MAWATKWGQWRSQICKDTKTMFPISQGGFYIEFEVILAWIPRWITYTVRTFCLLCRNFLSNWVPKGGLMQRYSHLYSFFSIFQEEHIGVVYFSCLTDRTQNFFYNTHFVSFSRLIRSTFPLEVAQRDSPRGVNSVISYYNHFMVCISILFSYVIDLKH